MPFSCAIDLSIMPFLLELLFCYLKGRSPSGANCCSCRCCGCTGRHEPTGAAGNFIRVHGHHARVRRRERSPALVFRLRRGPGSCCRRYRSRRHRFKTARLWKIIFARMIWRFSVHRFSEHCVLIVISSKDSCWWRVIFALEILSRCFLR